MVETHNSTEIYGGGLDPDIFLSVYRCTDGSEGILVSVEIERLHSMVLTEVQALIEAGSLETKGVITICPIDGTPFPMFLAPENARVLAAGLRKKADELALRQRMRALLYAPVTGRVN